MSDSTQQSLTQNYSSIRGLLAYHRDQIIEKLLQRWTALPWSPYQEFMIKSGLMKERAYIYYDLLLNALAGDTAPLFMDQEEAGYDRALKGFYLANVLKPQQLVREVIFELLTSCSARGELKFPDIFKDLHNFQEIMFEAYQRNALSFIRTREEIVQLQITQLHQLYAFTQQIIAAPDVDSIAASFIETIKGLFEVDKIILMLYRDDLIQGVYPPAESIMESMLALAPDVLRDGQPRYMNQDGKVSHDIHEWENKNCVMAPISGHGRSRGVVFIYNNKGGFKYTIREYNLLNQFLNILIVAMDNSMMLREIERNRQALQLMTAKMLEVREEERKNLAADIHDTFAQSLIGLNFKVQFCEQLLDRDPERLRKALLDLKTIVKKAVEQSRSLISALRPDLIDTVGLVPALKRLLTDFEKETGIKVTYLMANEIQMPSKTSICIFRVVQEALNNALKHSQAEMIDFCLQYKENDLRLLVSDNGRGFDTSGGSSWTLDKSKLGLLFMKERIESIGGRLNIHSAAGEGCQIEASIPL